MIVFSFGAGHYNLSLRRIKRLKALFVHPNANRDKIVLQIKKIKLAIVIRQHIVVDLFIVLLIVQLFVAELFAKFDVDGIAPIVMFFVFIFLLVLFYSLKGGRVMPNRSRSASDYSPF